MDYLVTAVALVAGMILGFLFSKLYDLYKRNKEANKKCLELMKRVHDALGKDLFEKRQSGVKKLLTKCQSMIGLSKEINKKCLATMARAEALLHSDVVEEHIPLGVKYPRCDQRKYDKWEKTRTSAA